MADAPTAPTSEASPTQAESATSDAPTTSDEPYQSLYRRYRPQRFGDVRGQDHVTRALRNAVRDDHVAHAYLFSGPRGTGKTSTARILAMALNCRHLSDGEPDGTCASCVDIRRGSSLDVQELDAASNRKIDEMRDLLSRVALGVSGRWKVYIIDEVHQLTNESASALLKTLEEPPAHVVFVLATTDPQKVMPTIRSRTQHFEFRLLGAEVLGRLLRDVNERAALGLPPEAIDLVVRRGHGSARDALSVLDQVAAAGQVDDESGLTGGIIDAVADRDAGRVLMAVAEATAAGRDPRRLATDLLDHLRNGFLATEARSLVHLPDDAVAEVEQQARRLGLAGIVKAMEIVGQAAVDMRESVDPRVTLEVALVRVASPRADESARAVLQRLEWLESQVAALTGAGGPAATGPVAGAVAALPPAAVPAARSEPGPAGRAVAGLVPTAAGRGPTAAGPRPAAAPPAAPVHSDPAEGQGAPRPESAASGAGPRPATESTAPGAGPRPATESTAPGAGRPPGPRPPAPAVTPRPRVGPAPPQPGRPKAESGTAPPAAPRPAGTRPALGAHRRGAGAVPDPSGPPVDRPAPPPSGRAGSSSIEPPRRAEDASPAGRQRHLPSRDELTKAWGDDVLPGLRPAVRAYVSAGRFVEVDGSAVVYSLPDRGLLARAQPLRGELEAALGARFGRPVPIRLVLDGHPVAPAEVPVANDAARSAEVGAEAEVEAEEDDPAEYNLDELADAGPALVSPEQRLLEAFPGAEEVSP